MKLGKKRNEVEGPDGFKSWCMVAACFSTTFLLGGSTRSAAVLYIAVMETFQVDRGVAAWPISLISGFVNFAGILSGTLSLKLGLRQTCVLGGCVSVVCLIACFFATSIPFLTVCFGILNGIGIGLMYNLNPVVLSYYFNKYKGFALGINYCGSTVAAMIFPLVIEFLYRTYGLRGAFLVYGAIMMNTPVISYIMHKPSWTKSRMRAPDVGGVIARRLSRRFSASSRSRAGTASTTRSRAVSTVTTTRERNFSISVAGVPIGRQQRTQSSGGNVELIMATDTLAIAHEVISEEDSEQAASAPKKIAVPPDSNIEPIQEHEEEAYAEDAAKVDEDIKQEFENQLNLREIFLSPFFYLLVVSYMIFTTYTDILLTVMVDLFDDKGIDVSLAIKTIPLVSVTDMLGRIILPLLADRHLVNRKIMYTFNILSLSALAFAIPFIHGYIFITIAFLLVGWFYGSTVVMNTVLVSEILGIHNLAVANGLISSSVGFIAFGRPAFIGYFRDTIGSYNPMLIFWGCLCLALGSTWSLVLFFSRRKTLKTNETSS